MTMVTKMLKTVSKSQFKAKALALFREVEASGESIVITDHGKPTLELSPYRASHPDPLEALRGSVLHYERPAEPVGEEDWEAIVR